MFDMRFAVLTALVAWAGPIPTVFAQGVGASHDTHRTHKSPPMSPPISNQFNLPAYSPMLMPYSPAIGAPAGSVQPPHAHHPMRPGIPAHEPIAPAQVAFFCPQLGGYYPTIQHCPAPWVPVNPDPVRRWR
ncbi:MAG: hypothetical protein ACKVQT_23720 [Burkholderiales bacterium]